MAEPYRPSNGTEGDVFEAKFCGKCAEMESWRKHERDACDINCRALAFSIGDELYPAEWIVDEDGPRCTAFRPEGSGTAEQYESGLARYDAAMAEMREASQ